jgi:hypothetical protein
VQLHTCVAKLVLLLLLLVYASVLSAWLRQAAVFLYVYVIIVQASTRTGRAGYCFLGYILQPSNDRRSNDRRVLSYNP